MILGFKDQFVHKILTKQKIHTIREDKYDRWKVGREIHFATGIRTPKYHQFMSGVCTSIQYVHIEIRGIESRIYIGDSPHSIYFHKISDINQMEQLAKNDGFDSVEDVFKWFSKDFYGKIIHWTDFKYS